MNGPHGALTSRPGSIRRISIKRGSSSSRWATSIAPWPPLAPATEAEDHAGCATGDGDAQDGEQLAGDVPVLISLAAAEIGRVVDVGEGLAHGNRDAEKRAQRLPPLFDI